MIKAPIFYYHSVGNQGPETLPSNIFREHLAVIKELDFTPVTFSELISLNPNTDCKPLVLSFDDGLLDNYENAVPILEDFNFKATFFVIPGFDYITRWVNPKTSQWSDFRKNGFTIPFPSMKAHHRRQLHQSGMEIGCHSMTHPSLNKIPDKQLNREISESKSRLQDELNAPVHTFCYPKGRYNRSVLNHIQRAGYQAACTTMPAYYTEDTPRYECGRFLVESPALFRNILEWSASSHSWTQLVCDAIKPPLKIKNMYF